MNKALKFGIAAVVVVLVFCQLILPFVVQGSIAHSIETATRAENVSVKVSSLAGFMLLAGHMDRVHIEADNAMVGQVRVDKLVLDGENVNGDLTKLDARDGSAVRSADRLELTGIISQDSLQKLLSDKLEQVDNITTTMDKDKLSATGSVKLLGRTADLTLTGTVFEENGGVYFHMTSLDIRNAVLGKAVIGNFFGDILLFDLQKMPVRCEVDDVEMQEGQVIIKASRHGTK